MENITKSSCFNGEPNAKDLAYFISLQEYRPPESPEHSAAKWDRRAEAWEKEDSHCKQTKSDERIQETVAYLKGRKLLRRYQKVADIGCGPGRFAVEFGKSSRYVEGFDISPRMIHYGQERAKQAEMDHVAFRVCDFQTLDIEKEGLVGKFDLVFSSLTPAIHGMDGLKKSMAMSRAWCCHVTHISSENKLEQQIMREVFHRDRPTVWSGGWFYSLFNVLFLMGYDPETSYYNRHQERRIVPDEHYVDLFLEHMLPAAEQTPENKALVWAWIREHTDADGMLTEISDTSYGRLLWDVRRVTKRSDYRPAEWED